jgi:HEAT repeat protein
LRYFCPNCWEELSGAAITCPACRVDLSQADSLPFSDKLRQALHHPEPKTAVRAAWILGERREHSAVPNLIATLESTRDLYLAEAAAEALGKIGDGRARPALEHALREGAVRVRRAARTALAQLEMPTSNRGSATKLGP